MRLHHAYILATAGAPEADLLVELGMLEGPANTHPGQGSANRRFFYKDFGLELIYFTDEDEARNGPGSVIQSMNRMDAADGSPFGLVFRSTDETDIDTFPGFPYQPQYFEQGQVFIVGDNAGILNEPTCVLMPTNLPRRPPLDVSSAPFEDVTSVRLSTTAGSMSSALAAAAQVDRVEIRTASEHLLEVQFGNGVEGGAHDLRPDLPLIIHC